MPFLWTRSPDLWATKPFSENTNSYLSRTDIPDKTEYETGPDQYTAKKDSKIEQH